MYFLNNVMSNLYFRGFCDCARNSTSKQTMKAIKDSYDEAFQKLADDPRFNSTDFTVIRQPHMRDMTPPIDVGTSHTKQDCQILHCLETA